jgi:hypothetical protein
MTDDELWQQALEAGYYLEMTPVTHIFTLYDPQGKRAEWLKNGKLMCASWREDEVKAQAIKRMKEDCP